MLIIRIRLRETEELAHHIFHLFVILVSLDRGHKGSFSLIAWSREMEDLRLRQMSLVSPSPELLSHRGAPIPTYQRLLCWCTCHEGHI
jgi:hypothetical protein